jgi:hypothetical protein
MRERKLPLRFSGVDVVGSVALRRWVVGMRRGWMVSGGIGGGLGVYMDDFVMGIVVFVRFSDRVLGLP